MRAQLLKTVEHTMSKQLLFLSMLWFVTNTFKMRKLINANKLNE